MVEKARYVCGNMAHYAIVIFVLMKTVLGEDDHVYSLGFTDVAEDCVDFKNKILLADLTLTTLQEHASLSGTLQINEDMENCELFIDVGKKLDNGREDPVMSIATDMCEAVRDKDAPWSAIFEAAGITDCPVPAATYTMDNLLISLDFMKDFLNHNWVHKYNVVLNVKCGALEEIACFSVGIEITED